MKITEIFKSIDGEGKRAGSLVTFIRTYGCPLRCSYCDSMYSVDDSETDTLDMSVDDIISIVDSFGINKVTVTGGEPLIQPEMKDLLLKLSNSGYDVNVETSGHIYPDYLNEINDVWYTVDYKLPLSNMESKMNDELFDHLSQDDVIKFVAGSFDDLHRMVEVMNEHDFVSEIYISPVFGFEPKHIVNFMLENQLTNCKIQLQMHKYIWDPNMRGV